MLVQAAEVVVPWHPTVPFKASQLYKRVQSFVFRFTADHADMEELRRFKASRKGYRTHITRTLGKVTGITESTEPGFTLFTTFHDPYVNGTGSTCKNTVHFSVYCLISLAQPICPSHLHNCFNINKAIFRELLQNGTAYQVTCMRLALQNTLLICTQTHTIAFNYNLVS